MNTEFFKVIQEQMRNENDTEKLHITPVSEYDYWAVDKLNLKFYRFFFDKNSIKEDSNTIDMWIVDTQTKTYVQYPILLEDYARTAPNSSRIEFTEEYIQKFDDDGNKNPL